MPKKVRKKKPPIDGVDEDPGADQRDGHREAGQTELHSCLRQLVVAGEDRRPRKSEVAAGGSSCGPLLEGRRFGAGMAARRSARA